MLISQSKNNKSTKIAAQRSWLFLAAAVMCLLTVLQLGVFPCAMAQTVRLPLKKVYLKDHKEDIESGIETIEERHGRGLAEINVTVTNKYDLQYHASLLIGDAKYNQTFIWDTGSTLLWTPLNNCSSCPSTNKYTPASSYSSTGTRHIINYLSGQVVGDVANDKVYITSSSGPVTMELLGVDTADSAIQGMVADGILGMGPAITGGRPGTLLVEKLKTAGIIGKNAFGVDYRWLNGTSSILLGGYDTDLIKSDEDFDWIGLKTNTHWTVEMSTVKYGGTELSMSSTSAVLDTGTSLTIFPYSDFMNIWNEIKDGKNCGYIVGTSRLGCDCDSIKDFKEIKIKLGEHDTKMPASAYVEYFAGTTSNGVCLLYIDFYIGDFGGLVILGDSFLREYYVYHDVQGQRVGLYGKNYSANTSAFSVLVFIMLFISFHF
ncbi:unnamed protein product [Moneuplotes crassus]|uniref:Peptidase A1 domain-containing protein n=1 Tax=Euplotes crassus TaxID=5936 RepID=A0AAD1UDC6_EUPCR|nr:unnamed protein product [Moneuplotes crassus]